MSVVISYNVRFLKLEPFYSDGALFKRLVSRPVQRGDAEALIKTRTLMKTLSIRRDKSKLVECKLPDKKEIIVSVEMGSRERAAYDAVARAIQSFARQHLDDDLVGPKSGSEAVLNAQSVLPLIMRLRQLCLDLRLVPPNTLAELMTTIDPRVAGGKASGSTSSSKVHGLSSAESVALFNRIRSLVMSAVIGYTQPEETAASDQLLMSPTIRNTADTAANPVEDDVNECAICFDPLLLENCNIFRTCKHILCQTCTQQLFSKPDAPNKKSQPATVACPLCRALVTKADVLSYTELKNSVEPVEGTVPVAEGVSTGEQAEVSTSVAAHPDFRSAKSKEIFLALQSIWRQDETQKVVIFSSFVSYLDIIEQLLVQEHIPFARIDGSCSQQKRQQQIRTFNTDEPSFVGPPARVMLCSLKACGVGITLTRANHVFLTDLWWAPSIDQQAIDRIHRLGQTREVSVYRFIVNDSIDEKIYALQKKKMELSKAAMEKGVGSSTADRAQRLEDLRMLLLS
jgi:DNA repair protein RAD5